jgi:hypothetical protein
MFFKCPDGTVVKEWLSRNHKLLFIVIINKNQRSHKLHIHVKKIQKICIQDFKIFGWKMKTTIEQTNTVNSLLFIAYQFSCISWVIPKLKIPLIYVLTMTTYIVFGYNIIHMLLCKSYQTLFLFCEFYCDVDDEEPCIYVSTNPWFHTNSQLY